MCLEKMTNATQLVEEVITALVIVFVSTANVLHVMKGISSAMIFSAINNAAQPGRIAQEIVFVSMVNAAPVPKDM